MAEITIYQKSDVYVYVLLQKRNANTEEWEPETAAQAVTLELFGPDGVSVNSKTLETGVSYVGVVEVDGRMWGKYRAMFHFEEPGVYESQARCTGQGGGQVAARDAIPVENL